MSISYTVKCLCKVLYHDSSLWLNRIELCVGVGGDGHIARTQEREAAVGEVVGQRPQHRPRPVNTPKGDTGFVLADGKLIAVPRDGIHGVTGRRWWMVFHFTFDVFDVEPPFAQCPGHADEDIRAEGQQDLIEAPADEKAGER